jgi:drug/metabolite transporter (DMT)-like permease
VTSGAARLWALAAALLFSTGGAGIKIAAFSGLQVSALRSGIASAALLLFLRGRLVWSGHVVLAAIVYAATVTLFVLSTKLTTAANAIFLQATAPLYLLLLGPMLLGEHFKRRDVVYMLAVAVGMISCFVGQPPATVTAPDPARGNILGLVCSITWALTLVSLRYVERGQQQAGVGISAAALGNLFASVAALPFAWPFPDASAGEWATLVYLGVFQIAVAYACLTAAIRHLPALEVSLLLLIEPVLNPVWTWILHGEHPGTWTIVGGSIIIAATAARSIRDARPAPEITVA